jgi:sugar/nucleoside kinase (ribokinase family)
MDVVTIGHTSADRVTIGGKRNIQLGGAAVYSAMASKIFSDTGIVSRVGEDFTPNFEKLLKRAGIDTHGLKKVKGKSSYFSIDYDKYGGATYRDYGINVGIHIRPQDVPGLYLNAKAFHIAPMSASKQNNFLKFIRKKSKDAFVSLNTHQGYFARYKKDITKLISKVDVFTINDEEATMLTGTKRPEFAIKVLKKAKHNLIIVTIGVTGCVVIKEGETNFFPSVYQPDIVDLTGCGDAFAGSFISSYIKTRDELKSANIANSVASINATGWNFKAISSLAFKTLESFQEFVFSRQRKLQKHQWSIEHFF